MVALNVGQDFKQRWLEAPEAVRQAYLDDLHRIFDILKPEVQLQAWIERDKQEQQKSLQKIDVAYAELKAQLIEEARIRHQQALEKKLEDKRAEEAAFAKQLQLDEERKFAEQAKELQIIRQDLVQETQSYTNRYEKNPKNIADNLSVKDSEMLSELDSVRIRLELEAESLIEQAVTVFRAKLHAATQEEIEYILKSSKFSDQ
ncbi:hypothetical protein M0D70_05705 [Acinetobacter portensis]|uniref:ATPase n=2 Tax=Acinetobacter TaxID=469 RepID=A0AB35UYL7_9GAMM|nr:MULTISPECIES: hypothetical protein [Acinetobacter]MCK7608851.1 hypothetical protein [Acinetobacter portensis]MCK7639665.1 hypothetical protein [Acinetobacter portensis]MDY6458496.1 hypothetical protein [Acinetobacter faecalis]MDY6487741.1 hypothetical protein [Acinetobacter faecalis]UPO23094.1 hypothetical protein MZO21_11690 [Acinetobacter portensis]